MAEYQPWMTKYRPQDFSDVVGQRHIVSVLKGMLLRESLATSMIFTGGHGRGKTTLARIFAKAVLCEHSTATGNACEKCPSCQSFNTSLRSNSNPNFIEKDAASTGTLADIRELLKVCAYPPVSSSKRVILLDEAHKISSSGWDALLKTLEDSPKHTIFLFCTTEVEKVNATILSRSKTFYLNPITHQEIVDRLKKVLVSECVEYEEQALFALAEGSDGHLRDALNLMEQAYFAGGVTASHVRDLTHRVDRSQIKSCLEKLLQDPMCIFREVSTWTSYMTPEDVCFSIQDLITRHQLALWKIDPENLIHGWGDVSGQLNWINLIQTPTTLCQLNGFLIQLVSKLPAVETKPSEDVPFTPTKSSLVKDSKSEIKEASVEDAPKPVALRPPPQRKPKPDQYQTKKPMLVAVSTPMSTNLPPPSPVPTITAPALPLSFPTPDATPQQSAVPLSLSFSESEDTGPVAPAMSLDFNTPLEAPVQVPPGADILAMFAVTKPIPPVG